MSKKVKIYFGAPLFSHTEQKYNKELTLVIRHILGDKVEVYLPQENESINDKSGYANSTMIYDGDNHWLDESDVLIALLDGVAMDAGLATEIGRFAHIAENSSTPKYILGLYSDSRQGTFGNQQKIDALEEVAESQFSYLNLYTVGAIKKNGMVYNNTKDLVNDLQNIVDEILEDDINELIDEIKDGEDK